MQHKKKGHDTNFRVENPEGKNHYQRDFIILDTNPKAYNVAPTTMDTNPKAYM